MTEVQHHPVAPFDGTTNGHQHKFRSSSGYNTKTKIGSHESSSEDYIPISSSTTTTSLVQLSATYTSLIQQYLNLHCTENAMFLAERYFASTNAPNNYVDGVEGVSSTTTSYTRTKRAHALYLLAFCYYRQRKLDPCRYLLLQHDSLWNDIQQHTGASSKNKKSTKTRRTVADDEQEQQKEEHLSEEEEYYDHDDEIRNLSWDIRYLFSTVSYELGYNEEAIQILLGGIHEAEPSNSTKKKTDKHGSSSDANARQRPHVAELMGHALVTRSSSSSSSSGKNKNKKDSASSTLPGEIKLSTGLLNDIPKGAAGLQLLGHLCRVTSRPHIAKECYRQALKQDPCLFTSFMALADLCNHSSSNKNSNRSNDDIEGGESARKKPSVSFNDVEEEEVSSSSSSPPSDSIDVESIFGVPLPEVSSARGNIIIDNNNDIQHVVDGTTTMARDGTFPKMTAQIYSGGTEAFGGIVAADTTTTTGKATSLAAASSTTGATPLLARASIHDQPMFDQKQQQQQRNSNYLYNQNLTLNLSSLSVKTPMASSTMAAAMTSSAAAPVGSYSMFAAHPPNSIAGGGGGGGVGGGVPRLSMASSKGRGPTALFASPDMTPIPKTELSARMQTPTKVVGPSFEVSGTSFLGAMGGGTEGENTTSHHALPMQTPNSAFLKGPPTISRAIETASAVAARLYYNPSPESKILPPPLSGRRVRFSSIGSAGGVGGDNIHNRKGHHSSYYYRRNSYDYDDDEYDDHHTTNRQRHSMMATTMTIEGEGGDVTMGDASILNTTNNNGGSTSKPKSSLLSDSAPSSPMVGKRSSSVRIGSAKRLFRTASFTSSNNKKEKSSSIKFEGGIANSATNSTSRTVDGDYNETSAKEEARGSALYNPTTISAVTGFKRRGSKVEEHKEEGMEMDGADGDGSPANVVIVDASEGVIPVLTLLATLGQGYVHLCRYECEDAIDIYRNLLPKDQYYTGWVLNQIGKAYFEMLNFHQAKRILEHMQYLEPYRMQGLEVLSTTLWHLKEEIALSSLSQRVTELDPNSPECWCVVGNTFALQKDHDTALSFFQRAIQVDPRFTYAHTLCGHEYRENEDLDQALKCYRHAIQLDPRHYNAWYGLASIFARQEKYDFAEYHYKRAIQIHPRSAVLLYHLATVQNARGMSMKALATLDKVYRINPNYDQARFLRANIYMLEGRHEAALRELIHVRNNMPMESTVYFSMGKMYKALGMKSDALNCFITALDLDPKNDNNLIKSAMDRIDEEDIEEDISTF